MTFKLKNMVKLIIPSFRQRYKIDITLFHLNHWYGAIPELAGSQYFVNIYT